MYLNAHQSITRINPRAIITPQNSLLRHTRGDRSLIQPTRSTSSIPRVVVLIIQRRSTVSHSRPALSINQATQLGILVDNTSQNAPRTTEILRAIKGNTRRSLNIAVIDCIPCCVAGCLARVGGNGTGTIGNNVTFAEPGRGIAEDEVHGSYDASVYIEMRDHAGLTLNHAVGIVLCSRLGVQGILVSQELAAIEAELIGICNESIIVSLYIRCQVLR